MEATTVDQRQLVELLERSFAQSERVIGLVKADQRTEPTPCPLFDVQALVGHMLFAAESVGAAGRRETISGEGPAVIEADQASWVPAFADASSRALQAWSAPGAMAGDIELPFGTFSASFVAKMYIVEQTTHAWDLATAIDATPSLDGELAEKVLPLASEILAPEYRGEEPMPFGLEIAVPAEAPVYSRLAAFMGRSPQWSG
jgi:uncharacterized protein (TIGR03086 family)